MPQQEENLDADYDSQLQGLFHEAERQIEDREAARRMAVEDKELEVERRLQERMAKSYVSMPQMLRPLVQGLEAVTRAAGDNTVALQRIGQADEETVAAQAQIPALLTKLQDLLEQKNGLNQRMFDALHEELKGYKDGFLLECVHKPIIRDLISLFDDLETIRGQMTSAVDEAGELSGEAGLRLHAQLAQMQTNVSHNCEFIVEILARLEVVLLPAGEGRLDKLTQRAVAVESAEDAESDGVLVRSVKPGFLWKGRVVRAEEVVIKKWKEGFLVACAGATSPRTM